MREYRTPLILAFCLVLFFAINGFASIIPANIAVDFRDSAWSGANGQGAWTVGDVTATAQGTKTARTYELYQDDKDGLGISAYLSNGTPTGTQDEINTVEFLKVGINGGMYLTGVWVTDLYDWEQGKNEDFKNDEFGHLLLNGSTTFNFGAFNNGQYPGTSNGELWVDFGGSTLVTSITFYPGGQQGNEYSVAGFTAVPIPPTILLFGTGVAGLLFSVRKRSKKLN